MTRTRLVLSRHGQTVWHRENRYAGSSDVDLDDVGREQAVQLARWAAAARPAAVVSSPLRRARETAAASAAVLALELVVVPELREVHFGVAEGQTLGELATRDASMVARFRQDPAGHHFPDGEPGRQAAGRSADALRRLAQEHAGATVLVVAHNTVLRLALCELLGLSVSRYRDVFPRLDNGALTELALPSDGTGTAALVSLNVPLAALVPAPAPPARPRAQEASAPAAGS